MIFSSHNPNNQLINTGNNASDFLGKRVFSEKNNDAIKSFSTAVFFLRKRSRHRQRQRSCLPSKEWKKKKGFSFRFWLILVKHVEFGARLSNPRWFVCERCLLTSLLSYNWLSIKLLILFNNAWLSSLHQQLEVSINSKKRRPFPGCYRREFSKTFKTLKWISNIYIFSQA